ncbi:hypothetical protein BJ165DRAFT_1003799 [Panaeolus papilionaceus]|nr:hypothetical protein BJ165DRAFT_1003799 [Panaeolus papilionaceus]
MEERVASAVFSDPPVEGCSSAPIKNTEPFLPAELERLIFEFAAYSRNVRRVDLMLVARRVHHWLRHIPFLVFVQLDSETFPDFDKPDSGLDLKAMGQYCRHLLTEEDFSGSSSSDKDDTEDDQKPITLTESEPERPKTVTLLQSCPNVQNLALWFGFPIAHYLPYIENMPLQMLSADLSSLSQDQLSLKLFQKLTHLDVVDFSGNDNWKFLEGWNNLTHLAFNFEVDRVAVLDVLASVKNLKAFVLVRNQVNWTNMDPEVLDNGDPRLVLMIIAGRAVVGDWKEGARGNVDFWVFGDWVVESRHSEILLH